MNTSFGEIFKRLREDLGYSQSKLGSILNIPLDSIKSWETNRRMPPAYAQPLLIEKLKSMLQEKAKKTL